MSELGEHRSQKLHRQAGRGTGTGDGPAGSGLCEGARTRVKGALASSGGTFWTGLLDRCPGWGGVDADLCLFYTLLAVMAAAHRMKAFNCNQLDLWLL